VCFVKLPILSAGCLRTGPGSHASRPAVRKPLPRRQMLGIGDVPGPAHIGDQVGPAEPPRCDFCMSRALTCEGAMTRCPICKSAGPFDGVGFDCRFHGRFRVSGNVLTQRKGRTRRQCVKSQRTPTPFFASKNDPSDGAETGAAESHIAEQSRSWRSASGEREVKRGS